MQKDLLEALNNGTRELVREQERRGEIKRKKRDGSSSIEAKHVRGTTTVATALSLAKEARSSAAGTSRFCSNKESRENKCSHCKSKSTDKVHAKA